MHMKCTAARFSEQCTMQPLVGRYKFLVSNGYDLRYPDMRCHNPEGRWACVIDLVKSQFRFLKADRGALS
ncbi:hypothetical protein Mapa_014279 [Marchantia paleacea]|nr:hypothetical protein Mapa_014279 [Marchantia paleacea]